MRTGVSWLVGIGLVGFAGLSSCGSPTDDPPRANSQKANRLAKESSPYLLLHAHNPVDWYPWGPEALERARAENKPIFLSIGYSSCYWCHVMERESFMDPEIAKALNAGFISIKVDREERPDVDQIYMAALQALGPGGWPMSMFLTPDGRPFFGGTYFPPRDRQGSSGFLTVVNEVAKAWTKQRDQIEKAATAVTEAARQRLQAADGRPILVLSRKPASEGADELAQQFDPEYGGFGFNPNNPRRPKFPQPVDLLLLLDPHLRDDPTRRGMDTQKMVFFTLDRMARGGIRDHLGGGYHRYSTDRFWHVPHFEKMLYDNAQLASIYLLAYELTKDTRWSGEAQAIFEFIAQKMTSPEGGFYSSLDAETEGEEGAYYVWTKDQVKAALGDGAQTETFFRVYGLSEAPGLEGGRYVLHEPRPRKEQAQILGKSEDELEATLRPTRAKLLAAREERPAPRCDDKILTGWNGLMIAAYADGYRVLKVDAYRQAAVKGSEFLLAKLRLPDERLLRSYRAGKAKLPAYLEDYAFLAHGLLRLHEATGEPRWLKEARALTDRMIADFEDSKEGGWFFTAVGHEKLLARAKEPFDGALPSGSSMAILNLIELARLTGDSSYLDRAGGALAAYGASLARIPAAVPLTLVGLERYMDARPDGSIPKLVGKGNDTTRAEAIVSGVARLAPGSPAEVPVGGELDAVVSVDIQPGWHLNSNSPGVPEAKPTSLNVARDSEKLAKLVKVTYPPGEGKILASLGTELVMLYENKVSIPVRLKLADEMTAGSVVVSLELSYQACNDRLCRAPAKLVVPLQITTVSGKK
jgi:uncharacterized protein YyaL (SSP411 family)